VESYAKGAKNPITRDERLAMTRILLHRHAMKTGQRSLFETHNNDDAETATEPAMRVGANLAEGARVHLLHDHKRPLYYGLETLCDAASMNAEQFLFLCSPLVEQAETCIIRGRSPEVEVGRQHALLRARAKEALEQWRFPHAEHVRRLGHGIAKRCLKRSLERNAPLGPGANALGILQADFDKLIGNDESLRQILHAALANNAFSLVRNHDCKRKKWTLLQLNGLLIMDHGLSLRWGGFVEAQAHELIDLLAEEP
jgi:hypothetical protein